MNAQPQSSAQTLAEITLEAAEATWSHGLISDEVDQIMGRVTRLNLPMRDFVALCNLLDRINTWRRYVPRQIVEVNP